MLKKEVKCLLDITIFDAWHVEIFHLRLLVVDAVLALRYTYNVQEQRNAVFAVVMAQRVIVC